MITWAIAYAVARGAAQNWFWLAIPVDFVLIATAVYQIKEYTRYQYLIARMRVTEQKNDEQWKSDFSSSSIPKVG